MVEQLVKDQGGTLEVFYYAFGTDDLIAIADLPDGETMAAISLAVNASGAVNLRACECFEVPLVVSAMVVEENALASFNELGVR